MQCQGLNGKKVKKSEKILPDCIIDVTFAGPLYDYSPKHGAVVVVGMYYLDDNNLNVIEKRQANDNSSR